MIIGLDLGSARPLGALMLGMLVLTTGSPPAWADNVVVESGIYIQVKGLVRRPGVYRLFVGSRIADAIQAAGGLAKGADPSTLPLASAMSDGETLIVPAHEVAPTPAPPAPRRRVRRAARRSLKGGHPVYLNTATLAQMMTLPGIGAAIATDILTYRHQHGEHFRTIDELREVPGIGQRRIERLRPLLRL
jgi:competence protein ComEA